MNKEKNLTRADIAKALCQQTAITRVGSIEVVSSILNHMIAALINGETVKIPKFGTFDLLDKKRRMGRNPKTGVEAPISSRRIVTFRASQQMRQLVK